MVMTVFEQTQAAKVLHACPSGVYPLSTWVGPQGV
jgi:hypothetical protein